MTYHAPETTYMYVDFTFYRNTLLLITVDTLASGLFVFTFSETAHSYKFNYMCTPQ